MADECNCPSWVTKPGTTFEQLRLLGQGCSSPRWVCPTLDKARRLALTDYYRRTTTEES